MPDATPPGRARPQPSPAKALVRPSKARPSNFRPWRWIVPFLILLAIAAFSRPAYHQLRTWRAGNIVRQAEEFIRQQLWTEAMEKLDAALKIDPASTAGLRALSRIYTRFELPSALPVYRAILNAPDHNDRDLHEYIDVALKLQRFDIVEGELSKLLARTNVTIQTRIQAAEFFFRQGDLTRALAFAEDIRRVEPTNSINQLRVARILLQRGSAREQADALNLFLTIKNPSPFERLNILEILSNAPALPRRETIQVLDRTAPGKDASPAEFYLSAQARLRVDPANRSNVVAEAVERYAKGTPEQQGDLCGWLSRAGEYARVFALWRPEDATKHSNLLANYLDTLYRAGRWGDLQRMVSADLAIESWFLEALRATAAAQLKQPQLAEERWRRAFEQTATNPIRLRSLGDFAARGGFNDEAIKAYESLTKDRLNRATAFRRLAAVLERTKSTERLRVNAQAWSVTIPDDPQPELSFCYLSALVGRDVEVAYPRATNLLARQSSRLPYRAAVAFLELRRNNPRGALERFERIRFDNPNIPVLARLVHAAVLEANGQLDRARETLVDVKLEPLLPEEQEIIRRIRGN